MDAHDITIVLKLEIFLDVRFLTSYNMFDLFLASHKTLKIIVWIKLILRVISVVSQDLHLNLRLSLGHLVEPKLSFHLSTIIFHAQVAIAVRIMIVIEHRMSLVVGGDR